MSEEANNRPSSGPPPEGVWVVYIVLETGMAPAIVPTRYVDTKADAARFSQELMQQFQQLASLPDVHRAVGFLGITGVKTAYSRVLRHSPLVLPAGPLIVGKA